MSMTDPDGPVLVLSAPEDATADLVESRLKDRKVPVVPMDTGDFPTRMRLDARNDAGCWTGTLRTASTSVRLEGVRSVYYRRPTRFRLPPGLVSGDTAFALTEAKLGVGGVLTSLAVTWVNHPARMAHAEYKPIQLAVADQLGLAVPRTLVTNDVDAVRSFARAIGRPIVCKTFSSLLLDDGDGTVTSVFTTTVDPAGIDRDQLAATAHLFQERVPKAHDARVTMVGHTAFAVAAHTDTAAGREDWRADYRNLRYQPTTVPDDVRLGMSAYLDHFGLRYGAFDFVVEPAGQWVFLECNPNGQWLWLEDEADQPISAALAAVLAGEEPK
jgi:ATP-grasp ribosomal peptide maturase